MGWKASTIIINKPTLVDNEKLLHQLGFTGLTRIEDAPFEVTINPEDNKVYIGTYKDNLLICDSCIPMQFFESNETEPEKVLKKNFPGSEICSIILHSGVNLWGYSVIKNGKKIRARAGSSENGTFLESGEPLDEEKDILSRSTIDKNGQRRYIFEDIHNDPMTEDQVGENFVFAVSKRYFGRELDSAEDLLFDTTLAGYAYATIRNSQVKEENKKNKWLPYIIVFMLLIVWQILKRTVFN